MGIHDQCPRRDGGSKPAFRAVLKKRRCLVPMVGYYEWSSSGVYGTKDPWFIHAAGPLWTAGLWRVPSPFLPAGNLGTFTIVTRDSSGLSADIHGRQPHRSVLDRSASHS